MKWSKADIAYLQENYSKNISLIEIGKKLNRTRKAISHKASRLGILRPRFPSDKPSQRTPRTIIDKRYYEKNKAILLERRRKDIKKFRSKLKNMLGGKCSKCNYNKSPYALDFHHTRGKKEANISFLIKDGAKQKALKEIEKCILLCANCHREVHHKDE